jgi:hypothetical protein
VEFLPHIGGVSGAYQGDSASTKLPTRDLPRSGSLNLVDQATIVSSLPDWGEKKGRSPRELANDGAPTPQELPLHAAAPTQTWNITSSVEASGCRHTTSRVSSSGIGAAAGS